ncbi:MAG TPA: 30S ribosomal protein S1 [Myxococcota bacterium]|nr:30S ribosomal protein S1 [Myxococcota bacterium]
MTHPSVLDIPLGDLDENQFQTFYSDFMGERGVREQTVVKGKVIDILDDWVVVDISYKAEGYVPREEFLDGEGQLTVKVGDDVDVFLPSMKDDTPALILSKEKADLMKAWDEISKAVEKDEVVSGVVQARVKGGLSVNIGVKAFLPGSQVDLRPVKNLDKYIGETLQFKIIKFNKKRGNIVLSRRVLLEQERAEKREETLKRLQEGVILTGVVKNITDYGAFIDLGGIDGLLHITDMSWGRLAHPSEMFEVGQSVEVKVLKYDPDSQRVSLGYKQIQPDPWEEAEYKYPIGAIVRGKVVSVTEYGAFVELEDGIEGLVHISEMTWNKRIKSPAKLVNVGDVIEAKVQGMDVENKRISLSMKQLETNPWDLVEQQYPVGSVIRGKIRNITDFGIFVGIDEGIDGLVHISDLSWGQRIGHPTERFRKGDEVEARVLAIDKDNERFSLGIKQLTEDPWYTVQSRYYHGQVIEGPVVHVTDFGVFVELEDGVEGLVHVSELASTEQEKWQEAYPVNRRIHAEITHINSHDRRISLSERMAVERAGGDMDSYMASQKDSSARLGDVMGDLGRKLRQAGARGSDES